MAMRLAALRSLRLIPSKSARLNSVITTRLLSTSFYLQNEDEGNSKTSVADSITITKNANINPDLLEVSESQGEASDSNDHQIEDSGYQADIEIAEMILDDLTHTPIQTSTEDITNDEQNKLDEIGKKVDDLVAAEMLLADSYGVPIDSGYDIDDVLLQDTDMSNTKMASVTIEDEESFNIDEMILNSADNESSDSSESSESDDDDITTEILSVALENVPLYGWTHRSIEDAINVLELSPSSNSLFKRGPVDLVLFFIEQCNNALTDHLAAESRNINLDSDEARTEFIEKAIQTRLKMLIPYIDSWPQAMTLMASPMAAKDCFENGANLIDEIWYHAGDMATDMSWYTKRGALAATYVATEMYMLNDKSPDFADTWAFLHRRMLDLKAAEIAKNSMMHAIDDTCALATSAITTAQNILGVNSRQR